MTEGTQKSARVNKAIERVASATGFPIYSPMRLLKPTWRREVNTAPPIKPRKIKRKD